MMLQRTLTKAARRGLTLIELLVVLMILIALGGVLVPLLPSMLTRAHVSSTVTTEAEAAQNIITYQQLYSSMPNNWDALGDGTTIINYMMNGAAYPPNGGTSTNQGNGEVTALTLSATEASALQNVGITTAQAMVTTAGTAPGNGQPFDPTFNYYIGATATSSPGLITIATGTVLAGLDPTTSTTSTAYARCVYLNLPVTGRYVLLGIGPRCSMIGTTAQTPPVHFGDTPVLNPEYGYGRFCACFKVSDQAVGANYTSAQLVGVFSIEDDGLGGIQDHLQNWYQLTTGGS